VRFFRVRLIRAHDERREADVELQRATADAQQAEEDSLARERTLRRFDEQIAALDERFSHLRPRAEGLRDQARVAERGMAVLARARRGPRRTAAHAGSRSPPLQTVLERLSADEEAAARAIGVSLSGDAGEPGEVQDLLKAAARAGRERRCTGGGTGRSAPPFNVYWKL